jgi:hypothetical protein
MFCVRHSARCHAARPIILVLLLTTLALTPARAQGPGDEPPRPLDARGAENLEAFTRLLGLVRFFHPSDAVASMGADDWESFAIAGVQRVEGAADAGVLQAELEDLFAPLAPQVLLFPSVSEPPVPAVGTPGPDPAAGRQHVAWLHFGVGLTGRGSYRSERVKVGRAPEGAYFRAEQTYLDAVPLRGKEFQLTLATRFAGSGSARIEVLAYTFTGAKFFSAPIPASSGWAPASLVATMPPDAYAFGLGVSVAGEGTLDFDDVHLRAEGVDWTDKIVGNPTLEEQATPGEWPHGWEPASSPWGTQYDIAFTHGDAFEGELAVRIDGPRSWPIPQPHRALLGGGLSARLPVALLAEADGSVAPARDDLPLATPAKPAGFEPNAFDRASRLAGIALAWGVFDHFYPYFDLPGIGEGWESSLGTALASAATDADEHQYRVTLRRFQAALDDDHARHDHPRVVPTVRFAFTWDWIEGALRVTSVEGGATHGLAVGDRVLAVDGEPAADALARLRGLISGATFQFRQASAILELAAGFDGDSALLTIEPISGAPVFTVEVPYTAPVGSVIGGLGAPEEPRPPKIAELEPGIWYVDVTRIDAADFYGALGSLASADGVVFDLRGYPWTAPFEMLYYLSDLPVSSARFEIAYQMLPDGGDRRFWDRGYFLGSYAPRIGGRHAWITDGRALSQSETWLGVVEGYGLGEIVGGPSAGTNGNINPFTVVGGYGLRWTGMRVRKHDGSPHHGVGIEPTIPVTRTLAGLLAGRDEMLEAAIAAVRQP